MINSIVSTKGARFATFNLKDFYLHTPISEYEYMRIPASIIPETILDKYNLRPLIHNGFVYVEIRKDMYGLPQAGKIVNNQAIEFVKPHGNVECLITPWIMETQSTRHTILFSHQQLWYKIYKQRRHHLPPGNPQVKIQSEH